MSIKNKAAIIAIDGPGGAGKGTISARLARQLGWSLLDSGALYRLLALWAEQKAILLSNETKLAQLAENLDIQFISQKEKQVVLLDRQDVTQLIRTENIGKKASQLASLPCVREALLARQKAFRQAPGLIADGRDMGTTVFPDANLKIFLTASPEERARRRYLQLKQEKDSVTLEDILVQILLRDKQDTQREISPLKCADDAVVVDSTLLSLDQVIEKILDEASKKGLV